MGRENQTVVTEFILVGFSSYGDLQITLFVVFFLMFIITLAGNTIIIITVWRDRSLHTPMYFFLSVFSISEIGFTLNIIPNTLRILLVEKKTISFLGCATQMFIFIQFGCIDCIIMAVMGYDRYVCICKPLHYQVLMNWKFCTKFVVFSAITLLFISTTETSIVFSLPFCGPNKINHFFCDVAPMFELACSKNYVGETVIFINAFFIVFCSSLFILLSYILILNAVLKIPTTSGKHKAFSTCSSHIIVVVVHFGCASIIYLSPKSWFNRDQEIFISVTFTMVTPLLNPVVYSLRNKDVQLALKKSLCKSSYFHENRILIKFRK